jgi:hypothetical protein
VVIHHQIKIKSQKKKKQKKQDELIIAGFSNCEDIRTGRFSETTMSFYTTKSEGHEFLTGSIGVVVLNLLPVLSFWTGEEIILGH